MSVWLSREATGIVRQPPIKLLSGWAYPNYTSFTLYLRLNVQADLELPIGT